MLEEQLKELIEKFGLTDKKAITFGHPKMKIPKSKAMNEWVKENNAYLIEHNHFYNK